MTPDTKDFFVFYERFFIHTSLLWVSEIPLVTAAVSASQRHLFAPGSEPTMPGELRGITLVEGALSSRTGFKRGIINFGKEHSQEKLNSTLSG